MPKRCRFTSAAAVVLIGRLAIASPVPNQIVPDRLDLRGTVAFALENNLAIRQAREQIRQQEGVVTTVSAAGLPSVSSAGGYQKSNVTSVVTGPGGTPLFVPVGQFWRVNLIASQTLLAGGGVRASIRSAELTREAAVLGFQAVVNRALLDVRTGFFDVLLAREQIKVQEQNLDLLEGQLKIARDRFEVGMASDFERLRAEVAVANAKVPLIRARNDLRLAGEDLRRVMGLVTSGPAALQAVPEFVGRLTFEPAQFELGAALAAAEANRPDLRRLAKLAAADTENVSSARSRFFPSLAMTGGGDLRKGATDRFADSLHGLRVGVQTQWKVDRSTSGLVIQARSRAEQARLAEGEARLAAEIEVRTALSTIEQASELATAMQKTIGQAEEAVRLATARFENGIGIQLDVLKTQVELTTARTSQLRAYHGYNVAVARLRNVTGATEVEYREIAAHSQAAATSPRLNK